MPKYYDITSPATFGGLGTKIGMIFMLVLLMTLALVIYTVQSLGKNLVINQSLENMQEKGNRMVNNLDDVTEQMQVLTSSVAGGALPFIERSKIDKGASLNQYIYQVYHRFDDEKIMALVSILKHRLLKPQLKLGYTGIDPNPLKTTNATQTKKSPLVITSTVSFGMYRQRHCFSRWVIKIAFGQNPILSRPIKPRW